MFDLINVFEVFLPQLLLYPNPTDPLNGDAAALLMREPQSYNARVRGEPCSAIAAQLAWRGTHGPGHAHTPHTISAASRVARAFTCAPINTPTFEYIFNILTHTHARGTACRICAALRHARMQRWQ